MSKKKLAGITVACAIAMTVIIVMFTRTPTYTLSVSVSPSGAGSVFPSSGEYKSGTQITLTASPTTGYTFDYWMGGMFETSPTAVITIISDMDITAHFTKTYTLTTNISPAGAGSVSPSAGQYKSGSQVILTVTAASGYAFDHWGVSLSDTSSTKIIVMDSDKDITAHFAKTYALTTNISPSGAGSVSPSSGEYESGTQITLKARPATGYTFDCWSGDASGHASNITIEMDSDKDITAHFREKPPVPEVIYKITGTASRVNVTLSNATGGTEQYTNVPLPKEYSYDSFSDDFVYISAQNQGAYGTVTVSIYVNGDLFKTSTSSGAYVIATASGLK
jgi:uncharacterized repeat protein (TIGR02543 family)